MPVYDVGFKIAARVSAQTPDTIERADLLATLTIFA
jgi:hypothetical protein